jgi:hypothetical protein
LLDGDPDNEPFTPLVRAEPEEPPRLDSFLTELEASRDLGDSAPPSSNYKSSQHYKPTKASSSDQFAPFTLNSFDPSNRAINTSSTSNKGSNQEQLSTPQNNNFNKPPPQPVSTKPNSSLGFSGARQQEQQPPPVASSGSNVSSTGFPDLRDSKHDFDNSGAFNTSGFGSSFGGSSGFEQSQSRSKTTPKPIPIVPVVTPVIVEQAPRTVAPDISNQSSAKKSGKKKRRKSGKDTQGKDSSESMESSNSGEKMSAPPQKQLGMHMDTPEPSSGSGMRFDELYRLKGVVSHLLCVSHVYFRYFSPSHPIHV